MVMDIGVDSGVGHLGVVIAGILGIPALHPIHKGYRMPQPPKEEEQQETNEDENPFPPLAGAPMSTAASHRSKDLSSK